MSRDEAGGPGDAVYETLLERVGEGRPERRLTATRRAVELLGDIHRAFPVIHITGTNGKTSTSRIVESILRAYGLRTGLFTSPHLVRFNERIRIDGEPVSDEALARNWADIEPYIAIVDRELTDAGQQRMTFFEVLTVLGLACFADAPVDVAVIEVGMGGEWDSTNVVDGQVAVITPISLDHTALLGSTEAEIARTKAGIIKPAAQVVIARQPAEARAEIDRAVELSEATLAAQGEQFDVEAAAIAVGGQLITVRGTADIYRQLYLPLYGAHQAQNAAVAIAAVEAFLGGGSHELNLDLLEEGLAEVTSPGRLQLIGTEPTVIADGAHNPGGAASLADGLRDFFAFDEIAFVIGMLQDKDTAGVIAALAPLATRFYPTRSDSERAIDAAELARQLVELVPSATVMGPTDVVTALDDARSWAAAGAKRAVVVTGSLTLVGEVLRRSVDEDWKNHRNGPAGPDDRALHESGAGDEPDRPDYGGER